MIDRQKKSSSASSIVTGPMADDPPAPPPNVLDRKVLAFQFCIQQTLSLRDEEIDRLSTHLATAKSAIPLSKQRIRELDQEI
jgi:hypothetical protein